MLGSQYSILPSPILVGGGERFQYTREWITKALWASFWGQLLGVVLLGCVAYPFALYVKGNNEIRNLRSVPFVVGVMLPCILWLRWKQKRRVLESTVVDVSDDEIQCFSLNLWPLNSILEQRLHREEIIKVSVGRLGYCFSDGAKRSIFLPKGQDRWNELVEKLDRRLAPDVERTYENDEIYGYFLGWATIASLLLLFYTFSDLPTFSNLLVQMACLNPLGIHFDVWLQLGQATAKVE